MCLHTYSEELRTKEALMRTKPRRVSRVGLFTNEAVELDVSEGDMSDGPETDDLVGWLRKGDERLIVS